ncbi:hypothetical protein M9H77_11471 [Catharanthus roseus]|uniref:Uncharacterized protein n=1 Tax=Catharanthus roseus TaxID=4058 RepID=A0ACC0BEP0_CATRO|nr:hypothetical protein M9H77_11471 [Catharanthus roseus]
MSDPKIETDKFDGKSDFAMWRRKMKAVLIQNKIDPAICSPEEYPESRKGLSFKSKNGILHVCKGNLVMLKGLKRETLYILIGKMVCNSIAFISKNCSRENHVVASKDRPY